jgi:hypothetical protein
MSLIFATQLTGVATAALAAFAIITAVYAVLAFRKQSREVAILAAQNDRDIADRRQAQAARVFTGVEDRQPRYAHPYAKNGSDYPVYDAQLWQSGPGGLGNPKDVGMIPPGGLGIDGRDIRYLDAVDNTVLTFRDAAGIRWIRMPDGTLKEQEHDTALDSILAALGRPLPAPASGAEPGGQTEEAGAPGPP